MPKWHFREGGNPDFPTFDPRFREGMLSNFQMKPGQQVAWVTRRVGLKTANAWGLYDMHGNVWEWCEDWYHNNYKGAPSDGSAWTSGWKQASHVLRGGSWVSPAQQCRSSLRFKLNPDYRLSLHYGFRLVASPRP